MVRLYEPVVRRTDPLATLAPTMPPSRAAASSMMLDDLTASQQGPMYCCDALARTASETCRQHERLARLNTLSVAKSELGAAHAMVDNIDLALAECVRDVETTCSRVTISEDADIRQAANAMWLAAREYLRRHSIAEKASRQLTQHDAEKLGDLQLEYELEASALLGLKHAMSTYQKLRPDTRCP
jgi:predicted ribonuclease YlaK